MRENRLLGSAAGIALSAALLFGLSVVLGPVAERNREVERGEMMARLLPGSTGFVPEAYSGGDEFITAVHKGEGGYVIETVTNGYAGNVELMVGVDNSGKVTGVVVRNMEESYGLGANALWDTGFLTQFLHTSGEAAVGENVDALTGATVTSKAITKGVNAAVAFVTGADISSGATEWEG